MANGFRQQDPKLKGFFRIANYNVYIKNENEIYELDNNTMNLIHKTAVELKPNKVESHEDNEILRYLSDLGISIEMIDYKTDYLAHLQGVKIGIFGDDIINSMIQKAILENLDITVLDDDLESMPEEISVIVGTSFIKFHERFRKIHRVSMERNIPWFKFSMSNKEIILGPIFIPGSTACYECYLMRRLANIEDKSGFVRQLQILNDIYIDYASQYQPVSHKIEMAIAIMIDSLYAFLVGEETLDIVGKEKKIRFADLNVRTKKIIKLAGCDCKTHFSLSE